MMVKKKSPAAAPNALLIVGSQPEAIRETADALVRIMNAPGADGTRIAAIAALKQICQVNGTTISGCSFTN